MQGEGSLKKSDIIGSCAFDAELLCQFVVMKDALSDAVMVEVLNIIGLIRQGLEAILRLQTDNIEVLCYMVERSTTRANSRAA